MPQFILKANRDRNRPFSKQTAEQLEARLAAHERIQAISDEIRQRVGLQPVPENGITQGARLRLAELQAKASTKRKPKAKQPTTNLPPVVVLTPEQEVERIAAARKARAKQEESDTARLRELVAERALPVAKIAGKLGVTRQAIYQLTPKVAA